MYAFNTFSIRGGRMRRFTGILFMAVLCIAFHSSLNALPLMAQAKEGIGGDPPTGEVGVDPYIFVIERFVKPGREKATAEDKKEAAAIAVRANKAYRVRKEPRTAVRLYEKAIYRYPHADYYYELGNCLLDMKEYNSALNAYRVSAGTGYRNAYLAYYNMACASSLMKELKWSLRFLDQALSSGYRNISHIRKDPDMAFARTSPEFELIIRLHELGLSTMERLLVGHWHNAPGIGAGWGDVYRFYPNHTFVHHYSESDCAKRTLAEFGDWRCEGGVLSLSVREAKVIEGGKLVPATGSCASSKEIEGGTIMTIRLSSPKVLKMKVMGISYDPEREKDKTAMDGKPYWKFSINPDYQN